LEWRQRQPNSSVAPAYREGAAAPQTSPLFAHVLQSAGGGESSFSASHDTVRVVQEELKFHGVEMSGPALRLQRAGNEGSWKHNLSRDFLRKVNKIVPVTMVSVPVQGKFGGETTKKMPVVLPEDLFCWLAEHGELPSDDEISEYWNHMAMLQDIPWVSSVISSGAQYVPIYMWGDDSQYNERNEKILAVVCGSSLESRSNSKDTVYPLFTIRMELCLGFRTLQALLKPVVESFNRLAGGISLPGLSGRSSNRILRCLITDFLGDWKWHKEWFNLQAWWRSSDICHACVMTKHNFVQVPNPLHQTPRRSLQNFLAVATKPGEKSALVNLSHFHPMQIKFCSMHALNLGIALWIAGGAMTILCEDSQVWGDGERSLEERYRSAFIDFTNWAKQRKIGHSQPMFKPKHLVGQNQFAELHAKAWNCRVIIGWLSDVLCGLPGGDGDPFMALLPECVFHLAAWYNISEGHGRYLPDAAIVAMNESCDKSLGAYYRLAVLAAEQGRFLFPVKPKCHAWQELAFQQQIHRINSRFWHCFRQEDWVRFLKRIARKSHPQTVELAILRKVYLRLRYKDFGDSESDMDSDATSSSN